jgi:hypothetical protein
VGVLGQPQRVEAPILDGAGKVDHADRHVGDEHGDAVAHVGCPFLTIRQVV